MAPRLFQLDANAMAIITRNMEGEDGEGGLIPDNHKATWQTFATGPQLDTLIKTLLTEVLPFLDAFSVSKCGNTSVELVAWVHKTFTLAGTEALYGQENPFSSDSGPEEAFWYANNKSSIRLLKAHRTGFRDFEKDATLHMIGMAPSIFARKAYKSREAIFTAMKRYFANNRQERASGLTKARYDTYVKHGLSIEATARPELRGIIGTFGKRNT